MMRENNGNGETVSEENNSDGDCWKGAPVKEAALRSSSVIITNCSLNGNGNGNGNTEHIVKSENQSLSDVADSPPEFANDEYDGKESYVAEHMHMEDENESYPPEIKMEAQCEDNVDNVVEDNVQSETGYDAQEPMSDNAAQQSPSDHDDQVQVNLNDNHEDENQEQQQPVFDPNIWTLPAKKEDCTLEEIRRGQVINRIAPNECPVIGCGKKINENRIEPSPGTIASGLRTHVLFVHYENRRCAKKRKLGWSSKRKTQASPKKQNSHLSSPSTSRRDFDLPMESTNELTTGLNLSTQRTYPPQLSSNSVPGSIINRKVKQLAAKQSLQMSSLQSLMQATGGSLSMPKPNNSHQQNKQKMPDTNPPSNNTNLNPTTSSLFSILAGLTQQQQQQQPMNQPQLVSKNIKTAQGTNTINISQCSRPNPATTSNNSRPPVSSSLLSLLNEKISGNVASSLQTQLKKSTKAPTSNPQRHNISSPASTSFNSSSLQNSLGLWNGDNRSSYDNSGTLDSFIESIAIKTGSNIGPNGIVEAKRIIEKFTSSLICSSQTIADHYIAPYAGDVPQQKPEISSSDILLAYKMMHKSHGQP